MLSEEEIIKNLNNVLEKWQEIIKMEDKEEREIEMSMYFEEMPFYEIQGLLDLYNKEKEKNEFFQKLFSVSQNRKRKNRTMDYKKINSSNKTGMNGVCQDMRAMKRTGKVKYRAYITLWGKQFSLGSHSSLEEAKKARANGEEMVKRILEEE